LACEKKVGFERLKINLLLFGKELPYINKTTEKRIYIKSKNNQDIEPIFLRAQVQGQQGKKRVRARKKKSLARRELIGFVGNARPAHYGMHGKSCSN